MDVIRLHARYITSDYDLDGGKGYLFDDDAVEGALRATKRTIPILQRLANRYPKLQSDATMTTLKKGVVIIARNYWVDLDFDDRKRIPQIKSEVSKLIAPLKSVLKALEDRPPYVVDALNHELLSRIGRAEKGEANTYKATLEAVEALLEISETLSKPRNYKSGSKIRDVNACRELAILWEELTGTEFPRNAKLASAGAVEKRHGLGKLFQSDGADFVYNALTEIASPFGFDIPWVSVGQVQEALKALRGADWRSRRG